MQRRGKLVVRIITDSSADIPNDLLEKYAISVVPLSINVDDQDYFEGVDLTPESFYQKMSETEILPKTSQPTPLNFSNVFMDLSKNGEELLCLTISSGLSGTYQSANLGKQQANVNVTIFDTLAGSLGHGLQVIKAAELAERGYSVREIVGELQDLKENMNILILLDTLENVVKGGRLSKFQGSVAKVLNIKVILEGVNGEVEVLEKVRGSRRFFKRTLEIIGERKQDFSDTVFGITHTGNMKDVEFLKNEIKARYKPKDIIVNYMGATMGTYAGKGGTIVSFR